MKKTTNHVAASNEVLSAQTTEPVAPTPAVSTMTDPAVKQCIALLDQVLALLGGGGPLSTLEIQHGTKMRKGGAEVIPKILALCHQHGVTNIGSLTIREMSDELDRGNALNQVGLKLALVQKKAKDQAFEAYGRTWQIGMTMYTTLQRLAVDDPELAVGLEPVVSFFQTKKTKGTVRKNRKARARKKLEQLAGDAGATPATTTGDAGPGHAEGGSAPTAAPATATPSR
jgi:hypothetical protein